MTDREKLIELLLSIPAMRIGIRARSQGRGLMTATHIADHLIANGVTFATDNNVGDKWIPVTERLPEFGRQVLITDGIYITRGYVLNFIIKGVSPWCTEAPVMPHTITHWMPLPEPPKGE